MSPNKIILVETGKILDEMLEIQRTDGVFRARNFRAIENALGKINSARREFLLELENERWGG